MPTFTPPTVEERMVTPGQRLFGFFTQTMSYAVIWRNGHFVRVRVPSQEETDALVEGTRWFSGGRTYLVDEDTAALLEADGFTVIAPGYGSGAYGFGPYGD